MNRRQAIAALVSLPEIARISTAPVKETDAIVIEYAGRLSHAQVASIKTAVESIWPGRKVLVLSDGMALKVVAT